MRTLTFEFLNKSRTSKDRAFKTKMPPPAVSSLCSISEGLQCAKLEAVGVTITSLGQRASFGPYRTSQKLGL